MMKTRIHVMYHVIIALKDNMAATNITPARAQINCLLITGAGTSIIRLIMSNDFPNRSFSDTN